MDGSISEHEAEWRSYLSDSEIEEVRELERISTELKNERISVTGKLALIRNRCNTRKKNKRKA
jgi:hypothetical protein